MGFVLTWTPKSTMALLVALNKAKAATKSENAEEGDPAHAHTTTASQPHKTEEGKD